MENLPVTWESTNIESLMIFAIGGDWGKEIELVLDDYCKVKVIRGTEFKNWLTEKGKTGAIRLIKNNSLEKRQLKEGDIVVEISGGGPTQPVGRVVLIDKDTLENSQYPLVCSNFFRLLRLSTSVKSQYIEHYLTHAHKQGLLDKFQNNTTNIRNLSFNDFTTELSIPLPPLNEQRRIVGAIEQLTARSNKARTALAEVPKLIEQFRQSVLAAAFRGDLTADWREKNPDVEPASELLERIKIDRIRDAKSPKQIEKINEIYSYEESEDIDALPAHWQYTSLEKLANSLDYGTSAKSSSSGDVVVLRMGNLQGGEIDWSDLAYTSDIEEITKYNLQLNTVLFNRTNSPELVGKASIYRGDSPAIFAGYLIRIRNVEELDPEYLNYCLSSDYARGYCWKVKTDGVSQSNINAQKLGKFEIPFCSLKEQREVIGQIKRSFKIVKEIENLYQKNYSDLERLDRSILAKAFRGELVPQDPSDEPAAVLLDRIRAEREQTSTPKQRGKTTRKNSSKQLSIDGIE